VLTLGDASPSHLLFRSPAAADGPVRNDLFAKLWNEGKNGFKVTRPRR
jgi:hypothetical protein